MISDEQIKAMQWARGYMNKYAVTVKELCKRMNFNHHRFVRILGLKLKWNESDKTIILGFLEREK